MNENTIKYTSSRTNTSTKVLIWRWITFQEYTIVTTISIFLIKLCDIFDAKILFFNEYTSWRLEISGLWMVTCNFFVSVILNILYVAKSENLASCLLDKNLMFRDSYIQSLPSQYSYYRPWTQYFKSRVPHIFSI